MNRKTYFLNYGTLILGLFLAGCGGSDSSSPSAFALGSIGKVGATAIPKSGSPKPSFAGGFVDKGLHFLFNAPVANAAGGLCSTTAPIVETILNGAIEIDEAIVILDQVEADRQGDANDIKTGPFALDLLDNDPDAGESISMTLPAGSYEKLKPRFKRLDDSDTPPAIPQNIKDKLLHSPSKRRPSVWIKGFLSDGTNTSSCTPFTFVSDYRWEVTIPFVKTFSDSGNGVDLIVLFRLVDALKDALTANNNADAAALMAEVGPGVGDLMGPPNEFLDGRTKKEEHGTPLAEAWAAQIPLNMDVFAQNKDTVSLDDSTDSSATLIDVNASRISGDDNPSASDLAEPTA